jgi:CrcB protein
MGNQILLVGLGGAAGSILRYLLQQGINQQQFPYGTLIVNVAGCFLIGMLWALSIRGMNGQWRTLMVAGFCGGFTTFSAFTLEGIMMLKTDRVITFIIYTSLSVVIGMIATYAGFKLLKTW